MGKKLEGFFALCCRDLMTAYNNAWEREDIATHEQAVHWALSQPAPRFWISPEEAAREISKIEKGLPVGLRSGTNKHNALMELYGVYKRLRKRRFRNESILFVVSFACQESASRFFVSESRALKIINYIKKGEYVI